jgi:protein gp37
MSIKSTIEWTDASWDPIRGGTRIKPGCKNCYAAAFVERFRGVEVVFEDLNWADPSPNPVNRFCR